MNRFKHLIVLLILIPLLAACEKDATLSKSKEIEIFKIEASLNSEVLKKDIEGTIKDNTITLGIPKEIDITDLIATFVHNGKEILMDSQVQESTITPNNFSNALVYTVKAEDGSQSDYSIVIKIIEDMGIFLKSFSFIREHNPALLHDHHFKMDEDNLAKKIISEDKELIAIFETEAIAISIDGVEQVSGKSKIDFTHPVTYTLTSEFGTQKEYIISVTWDTGLPHFYIVTENHSPVNSKTDYVNATIKLEGTDIYADYEGTTRIRGRGNSTWGMPKKPFRLKLDNKAPLLGLSAEKDWILLANYLDGNLMLNAVASKMALLLEMPYTNTMIPVDVTLNGEYIGNYMFTEHKEVEKNRINVTDGGVLLELDVYYDEEWKFKSAHYELPVMIQYPELEDYSIDDAISEQEKIRADFQILEDAIFDDSFPNSNYLDYMDADALVNYLIVYNLTRNGEINHPKSTYIHKQKEGKYRMGPIWDFDWAFDFNGTDTYFRSATNPLLGNNGIGGRFFSRILVDPEIQDLYRQKWTAFKNDKFPELLSYIDEYADLIKLSQKLDYERWQRGSGDFMEDVQRLRTWVMDRASYIDDYIINFN